MSDVALFADSVDFFANGCAICVHVEDDIDRI